jgi:hypothetical protein
MEQENEPEGLLVAAFLNICENLRNLRMTFFISP